MSCRNYILQIGCCLICSLFNTLISHKAENVTYDYKDDLIYGLKESIEEKNYILISSNMICYPHYPK